MMQLTATIERKQIRELQEELGAYGKKLKKQLEIATNASARATKRDVAGQIYKTLAVTKTRIGKKIALERASAKGLGGRRLASAKVTIKHEKRLRLADFKPRQTRKGVSYRLNRRDGLKRVEGAFMGPTPKEKLARWDNGVRKRVGGPRSAHTELYGVSPWGVFVKRRLKKPVQEMARERLRREVERRIRFIRLKNQGAI